MRKSIYTEQQRRLTNLLRQLRKEAGLSQVELAKRLGQHQSFVSKYESGQRRLDLVELKMICESVGLTLTTLVRRFEKRR